MVSVAVNLFHANKRKNKTKHRCLKERKGTEPKLTNVLVLGQSAAQKKNISSYIFLWLLRSRWRALTRVIAVDAQGPCAQLGHGHDHLNTQHLLFPARYLHEAYMKSAWNPNWAGLLNHVPGVVRQFIYIIPKSKKKYDLSLKHLSFLADINN